MRLILFHLKQFRGRWKELKSRLTHKSISSICYKRDFQILQDNLNVESRKGILCHHIYLHRLLTRQLKNLEINMEQQPIRMISLQEYRELKRKTIMTLGKDHNKSQMRLKDSLPILVCNLIGTNVNCFQMKKQNFVVQNSKEED